MKKAAEHFPSEEASQWRVKAARRNRWMRSCIIGIPVFLVVLTIVGVAVGWIPWHIESWPQWPSPVLPPQPLALSWISGGLGWTLVILCVGCTALTIWLDRGRERALEPLALAALCLAVLGHAEAIYAAKVLANTGCWPVNLVHVSIWILCVSAAVGAIAWVRLLFAKSPVRGHVIASCAIVCSLCSAWIVHRFLVDRWVSPVGGDGIELPLIGYSRSINAPWEEAYSALVIHADGRLADTPIQELARGMPQRDGVPDGLLVIRADHDAPWSVVKQSLASARSESIWKWIFAARWETPASLRGIPVYAPLGLAKEDKEVVLHTLRIVDSDVFLLDGEPTTKHAALLEWLNSLGENRDEQSSLLIDPADDTPWADIIEVMAAVSSTRLVEDFWLGPFHLQGMR